MIHYDKPCSVVAAPFFVTSMCYQLKSFAIIKLWVPGTGALLFPPFHSPYIVLQSIP